MRLPVSRLGRRAHRALTREALAAGIAASYLSEVETRRKPGSFSALAALQISLDDLAARLEPQRSDKRFIR